jgi:hypothetical protein
MSKISRRTAHNGQGQLEQDVERENAQKEQGKEGKEQEPQEEVASGT